MKFTGFILWLVSSFVCVAQTNTDHDGYVTNLALLQPFSLTNSSGDLVTNAILVKLTASKFIYKTPNGSGGMMQLDVLPQAILAQIGYNPTNAAAAEASEKEKMERINQEGLETVRQGILNQQFAAEREIIQKSARAIIGRVVQRIDAGMLVDGPVG